MDRLQKVIANSGYCSRRKAENLISEGKVKVNGIIINELGTKVNELDEIVVENNKIKHNEPKEYYLLYKPRGYISSCNDELGRKSVIELIDTNSRIYPVGRLDYDTTGLLLLTNDGELSNILMHPKNKVLKTYLAKLEGILDMESYFKIKNGLIIDGKKTLVNRIKIKSKDTIKNTSLVEITIEEGRNHIVKRIFEAVNYRVTKLKRESYGFLDLGPLHSGEYRYLTNDEVKELYKLKK